MRVLGLDTATWVASVGLVEDGNVVAEESLHVETGHTDIILPLVQRVLADAKVALTMVEAIGVSIGPGSFSGLRIGLSTAKGFAYGLEQRIVGVSTLEALATTLVDWEGREKNICTVLDARRQEVYAALFSCHGRGQVQRLTADRVLSPAELLESLESVDSLSSGWVFIGDGAEAYEGLLRERYGDAAQILPSASYHPRGGAVARLASQRLQAGESDDLPQLVPLYIRLSDAERKRMLQKRTG